LEEVAMCAGHEVLMEVDDNILVKVKNDGENEMKYI
jgi:hypothetical protein